MNNKLAIIGIILIELIILMPIAFVDALTVTNVVTTQVTDTSATIEWVVDQSADAKVLYGSTAALGKEQRQPLNFINTKQLKIENLPPATQHFYKVASNNLTTTVEDDNAGSLYTFTTLASTFFLNATVPAAFNGGKFIDIPGKTFPGADLQLFVDNFLRENRLAGATGVFTFPGIELSDGPHTIKIVARSNNQQQEKTFAIHVDNIPPELNLSELPLFAPEEEYHVLGKVNEEVTLKITVEEADEDTTPPSKIENFEITSVQENTVELKWDKAEDEDFNRYVLVRGNTPLIFFDDPQITAFSDIGVNSDRIYTYSMFAVDNKRNVGTATKALTAKTLPGGKTNIPEPETIDFLAGIGITTTEALVNGEFDVPIKLGEEEQFYTVTVQATDKGGNTITETFEILLDKTPPEIKLISPKPNQEIFENFADAVTVRGQTEPGAKVYLYVKRTPFNSVFNRSFSIEGLSSRLETLDNSDLRADCEIAVLGVDKCKTHADAETIADAEGFFEFDDVDLTNIFQGAFRIQQKSTSSTKGSSVNRAGLKDAVESNLLFVAQDLAGRRSAERLDLRISTCFSGNFSFIAKPLPQYQSPTFLSIERLKSGNENLYFYFNFSYIGRSQKAFLKDVNIEKACGEFRSDEERYNVSCDILERCDAILNPDRTTAYVTCDLSPVEILQTGGSENVESFIEAFKNEMAFPLKIQLDYEEEEFERTPAASSSPGVQVNEPGKFVRKPKTQTFCEEVSYVVDAAFIDPRDVLPDWLLYDFVDTLNETIYHLNLWIDKLREILEWLAIGCVAAFVLKFVVQVYRRITCHYDRFFRYVSGTLSKVGGTAEGKKCNKCITDEKALRDQIESDYAAARDGAKLPGKQQDGYFDGITDIFTKQDAQDTLSDTCLGECYQSCAGAWDAESSLYTTYRFACDRVFGHASPSKWTENKKDAELRQKIDTGKGCANDQSVKGMPVRVQSCLAMENKYPLLKGIYTRDDQCIEIRQPVPGGGTASEATVYKIGQPIEATRGIYRITALNKISTSRDDIIIKQTEKSYLYRRPQTCEQICSGQQANAEVNFYNDDPAKPSATKTEEESELLEKTIGKKELHGACMIANKCINLQKEAKDAGAGNPLVRFTDDDKYIKVEEARLEGYTADCWSAGGISGDPSVRAECCCVSSAAAQRPEFYVPADIENLEGDGKAADYKDMDWSYRYWKIGWRAPSGASSFNPNRYIKGRDFSACFGRNHILYDGISGSQERLLTIDPIRQHISAFQCLAVSQIVNRLALLKNILVSLQTCMLQIRTTGTADGGVCKELFSQFICSFLWKVIQWVTNGCLPFGRGIDFSRTDSRFAEAVGVGLKGVFDSVGDTQTELANEYGNAKLNNLLGVGQEAVFRKVCLAAFGYDWEIDLDDIIDVAYDAPFATLVQAVLPGREFITFDPTNAQATYEYRSSWLINPGCDLEGYQVFLSCVTPQDRNQFGNLPGTPGGINCGKQGDRFGSNCDCMLADLSSDPSRPEGTSFGRTSGVRDELFFQDRNKIAQNQLIEVDSSLIAERIKTAPHRYDHLKFVLDVDQEYRRDRGDVSNCFPEGHENGIFYFPIVDYSARDLVGCAVNIDGTFSCGDAAQFFAERGDARFEEIKLFLQPDGATIRSLATSSVIPATYFTEGDEKIAGEIRYNSIGDQSQCFNMRILDENRNIIKADFKPQLTEEKSGIHTLRFNTDFGPTEKNLNKIGGSIVIEKGGISGSDAGITFIVKEDKGIETGIFKLRFEDASSNGILMRIGTEDRVLVNEKQASPKCDASGCEITIKTGVIIKVSSVTLEEGEKQTEFDVVMKQAEREKIITDDIPDLFLHLDLRHPPRGSKNCNGVMDRAFDQNIIVSNGFLQKIEIPIIIKEGKRPDGELNCKEPIEFVNKEGKKEIVGSSDEKPTNICVCGGKKKNCPTNTGKGYFGHCYEETCREFQPCNIGAKNTAPCVCNPSTKPEQFDCGKNIEVKTDDANYVEDREGFFCQEKTVGDPKSRECVEKKKEIAESGKKEHEFLLAFETEDDPIKNLDASKKSSLNLIVPKEKTKGITLFTLHTWDGVPDPRETIVEIGHASDIGSQKSRFTIEYKPPSNMIPGEKFLRFFVRVDEEEPILIARVTVSNIE